MARTPIIAGNWKMNKTPAEAGELAAALAAELNNLAGVEVVLCPPFVSLPGVSEKLQGTTLGLGAQNIHWEASGAFTGEVSPAMLAGWCSHVILGHSERRQFFCETDDGVNRKVQAALDHNLTPIICVGESLAQYDAGQTAEVVSLQVRAAYANLPAEAAARTIVAYEPIWAIGTGRAATAAAAGTVIGLHVRGVLADLYGGQAVRPGGPGDGPNGVAEAVRVQYGGSVNPGNIAEYMAQADIDGALVGGASLKAADFAAIVKAAAGAG